MGSTEICGLGEFFNQQREGGRKIHLLGSDVYLPKEPFNQITLSSSDGYITYKFGRTNSNGFSKKVDTPQTLPIPQEYRNGNDSLPLKKAKEGFKNYFEDFGIELL
ncbi:MAG: hypothetical protein GTN39_06415 [Candidatus Aenigmarchaeota archaeon]|nr:hypothetical protein [Candidatus Aenigmarchaeota archaeon]